MAFLLQPKMTTKHWVMRIDFEEIFAEDEKQEERSDDLQRRWWSPSAKILREIWTNRFLLLFGSQSDGEWPWRQSTLNRVSWANLPRAAIIAAIKLQSSRKFWQVLQRQKNETVSNKLGVVNTKSIESSAIIINLKEIFLPCVGLKIRNHKNDMASVPINILP